ncbi:hypothetical protein ADIWIN_1567 [Winogradskyella psychrotolerans RS-3]|uniref:Uncharacterized protein n=1 Tax=Winogradskyella psychrotolerans RS-3 TaxID=641526 RepID=S7VVV0_9FLAO|nr:hypothetical protein ADIWIN_1567 [Winogradskyella psychrotolerans RS-3]
MLLLFTNNSESLNLVSHVINNTSFIIPAFAGIYLLIT